MYVPISSDPNVGFIRKSTNTRRMSLVIQNVRRLSDSPRKRSAKFFRHYSGDRRPYLRGRFSLVRFRLQVSRSFYRRVSNAVQTRHTLYTAGSPPPYIVSISAYTARTRHTEFTRLLRVRFATAFSFRYLNYSLLFFVTFPRAFVRLTSVYTTRTIKHVRRRDRQT